MTTSVYDFEDYKKYLSKVLATEGKARGARSRLAEALKCKSAFISQVLNGHTHFSPEHAILIDEFLKHDEGEKHFFMLLVHLGRAGSKKLEEFYHHQIRETLMKRKSISGRVGESKSLTESDQMTYYSSWHYSAIHIATSIQRLQSKAEIANALNLSLQTVSKALEFLKGTGLVLEQSGKWKAGPSRLHLSRNSPMIGKHHANWRLKALQSMDDLEDKNLHFSGVWSLAEKDVARIRTILLEAIERTEPILRESQDETAFGFGLDFFCLIDSKN